MAHDCNGNTVSVGDYIALKTGSPAYEVICINNSSTVLKETKTGNRLVIHILLSKFRVLEPEELI